MKRITLLLFLTYTFILHAKRVDSNHLIIQIDQANFKSLSSKLNYLGYIIEKPLIKDLGIYLAKTSNNKNLNSSIKELVKKGLVIHAQPDHSVTLRSIPNDTNFNEQWNLSETSNNADIHAIEAWSYGVGGNDKSGNEVVVAVVDGGIDLSHNDLKQNIWINKNEIAGNGVDDDNNGYIDDINGWSAYDNSGNIPVEPHGTHVSGIIGAQGNNGLNVAGINWKVKIMAVAASSYKTSVVLAGYGYVLKQKKLWLQTKGKLGANIVATNSSFGVDYADCNSTEYSLWNKIYNEMGKVGILSVAASINSQVNVDVLGDVPTGCNSDYLVTVTNTTSSNEKFLEAGFGKKSIDLGAPGTEILSTTPNNQVQLKSGTSMATPHVTGAIAFLHSVASKKFNQLYLSNPSKGALELKEILLHSVSSISDLKDTTVSGGKLNLFKASKEISNY